MNCTLHFMITNNMVNLVVKITEQLTVRSFVVECSLRLRKTNRIKTIQGFRKCAIYRRDDRNFREEACYCTFT